MKANNPGAFDHLTPEDFSRAVLGHTLTRTTPDVYRDLDRSKLAYAVIDKAWEILWGQGTTRMGLDPRAITRGRERVQSLRSALAALGNDVQRLRRSLQALHKRARALSGDDLARALIESHATTAQIEELALQREQVSALLARAEQEYADARTRVVPLPEEMGDAEHERLLAEALNPDDDANMQFDGPLADSLTASDLKEIWGTTEQTINRWCREGFPTNLGAPWDNAAWIVDGPRRKRLPVCHDRADRGRRCRRPRPGHRARRSGRPHPRRRNRCRLSQPQAAVSATRHVPFQIELIEERPADVVSRSPRARGKTADTEPLDQGVFGLKPYADRHQETAPHRRRKRVEAFGVCRRRYSLVEVSSVSHGRESCTGDIHG